MKKMRGDEDKKGREFAKGIEKQRGSCFQKSWGEGHRQEATDEF